MRIFLAAGISSLALLGAACTPSSSQPPGLAVVTGGIIPCSGLPPDIATNLPYFAAGTVTVLKGRTHIRGNQIYLPTKVVARQDVGLNQTYRFALTPGDYVLQAKFPPRNGLRPNVEPYTSVTLQEDQSVNRDIPNMCM